MLRGYYTPQGELVDMKPDLTDEETDALAWLLRDTIDADHYPLSPRVQMWKGTLAKIPWSRRGRFETRRGWSQTRNRCRNRNIMRRRERAGIGDGEGAIPAHQ